jgi:membrane-anchored protein YejM (alkaline phosphatase superfamily)
MSARRRLLRWGSWFAVVNAALLGIVGLQYLWYYAALMPSVAWVYAVLAYVGQLTALGYLPFLLLVPVMLLVPRPRVILPLGVLLASAVLSFLVLDTLVFAEHRYHLDVLTFVMLELQTWAFLALYFLLGLGIEAMLAVWVWRRSAWPPRHRMGRYLALGLGSCFLASHLIHAWADAHNYVPVTAFTRYLPLYFPLKESRRMARLGLVDEARVRQQRLLAALGRPPDGELNYPRAPLRCEPRRPMLNVLLVVMDGMRADALRPDLAPRLVEFAQGAIRFDAHYSGGNASRAGMFSLFYGLPATYWDAFADVARPPVLMDLFRQHGYQLGLFSSSPVYSWVVGLDRTALARIPNLRLETISPYPGSAARDRIVTDEWYEWLERRDPSRPFFGFLFYNAAVAFEPPDNYPLAVPIPPGASEWVRRHARYLTAVQFLDALIGRVLDDLERRGLRERTVVIFTSDHGMEFDESGQGFRGHGTAYSDYQMHTPLAVRWPGRPPGRVVRRTSHFDVAPTLLTGLFGCANPPSDYASGHDLFSGAQWDWLIGASHLDFALIEPERVTIVRPNGYEIRDREYRLIPNPTVPRDVVRAALNEMRRFYR